MFFGTKIVCYRGATQVSLGMCLSLNASTILSQEALSLWSPGACLGVVWTKLKLVIHTEMVFTYALLDRNILFVAKDHSMCLTSVLNGLLCVALCLWQDYFSMAFYVCGIFTVSFLLLATCKLGL